MTMTIPITANRLTTELRLLASKLGARLFRNNVGLFWAAAPKDTVQMGNGSVLLHNPRRVRCGLRVGSGDLIGWTPTLITQEMVGQTVAVFTSVEVKTAGDRMKTGQHRWRGAVRNAGGRAIVARQTEDLLNQEYEI